jgi:major membrane immunogen (membrane-anchored lipoprotein)
MKKILFLVLVSLLISCGKKGGTMMVVGDCTGVYLQYHNKDYKVCNKEMLSGFKSGTIVRASFRKIRKCETRGFECMMAHENEGYVEVLKIERK